MKKHNSNLIGLFRIGLLILLVASCVQVVSASERVVQRGGIVYIGETDLDVSNCVSSNTLAWWYGSLNDPPTKIISVSNAQSYSVDITTFSGYTGAWYNLYGSTRGPVAFRVAVCPSCKVQVMAHPVPESGSKVWHTFIVYTDEKNRQWFYRGGPLYKVPIPGSWLGPIITDWGPFHFGTIDFGGPRRSVLVAQGGAAFDKGSCFKDEMNRINRLRIPYAIHGPNSNTVTRTALHNCKVPEITPVTPVFGWNHPYI